MMKGEGKGQKSTLEDFLSVGARLPLTELKIRVPVSSKNLRIAWLYKTDQMAVK
jgi:hypothetical protein